MTRVLVLNTGSSSVKWTVLAADKTVLAGGSEPWAAEDSAARADQLRVVGFVASQHTSGLIIALPGIVAVDILKPGGPLVRSDTTSITRRRYDRIAPIYDALEWLMEFRFSRWRREIWELVDDGDVLELGIGTGKNLRHHPPAGRVTGLDISPRMLAGARRRATRLGSHVRLELGDAQALPHHDASFDTVVATFVFCSVPDPLLGLREARRVLRPGGRLLLLEHVLSERPWLRWLMRRLDPLSSRLWGAHLNRDTVATVKAAGFADVRVSALWLDAAVQVAALAPQRKDTSS